MSSGLLKEAERLWREGLVLARQRNYTEALTKFLASRRLIPAQEKKNNVARALLSYYIGRTYHIMKKALPARDNYRSYLRLAPKGKHRKRILVWLKQLYPEIRARLLLDTVPPALCRIKHPGGEHTAQTPISQEVEAGALYIQCTKKDYLPEEMRITLTPQQEQNLRLALRPKPKPRKIAPPPKPVEQRWIGYLVGGIGLAALAAGGGFGVSAMLLDQEAHTNRDLRSAESSRLALDQYNQAQSNATIANILYVTGGVLAVTGVIIVIAVWPRAAKKPAQGPNPSKKQTKSLVSLTPFLVLPPNKPLHTPSPAHASPLFSLGE
ncbi:MAG: hypothetical protein H6728_09180 [Myxococcales bacterium]|nr:hypothetical protein [Myxococcales bacterium]MCB9643236.1 hypothetical protein [Myxococcales bacterium]